MRAEVAKADQKLPPVKGWEDVYTPGKHSRRKNPISRKWVSTGKWSSGDQTLECSRHPSAESAGQFVCQTRAMSIL